MSEPLAVLFAQFVREAFTNSQQRLAAYPTAPSESRDDACSAVMMKADKQFILVIPLGPTMQKVFEIHTG